MDTIETAFDPQIRPFSSDDELLDTACQWARTALASRVESHVSRPELLWPARLAGSSEWLAARTLWGRLGLARDDVELLIALAAMSEDEAFTALRRHYVNDDAQFTIGFAVGLLASDRSRRRALLARLDAKAPLRRLGLVHVHSPRPGARLSSRFIDVDEIVLAWLDGRPYWPDALVGKARWVEPCGGDSPVGDELERSCAWQGDAAFVALSGPSARATLDAVRAWADHRILHVTDPGALTTAATLARLHGAVLFAESGRVWAQHAETVAALQGATIILDVAPRGDDALRATVAPLFEIALPSMGLEEQVTIWKAALEEAGVAPLTERELRGRVCDMALGAADIRRTAWRARWQSWLDRGAVHPDTLRAMATANLNQGMYAVADRIPTTLGWNDVVLPEPVLAQLMELITYSRYQREVFDNWGFGAKVPYGRANSSLFYGPPGTGKTMMAGIIARELGLDLFRVDMSRIVSKYIGETEKNLARVFDEAAAGNAVLLFDEADSLFARRTEVKSSHDRYANLEVNYLLQRIEMFEGITILTTNFRDNIDPAFARRLRFKIEFPTPSAGDRALLWERMLPSAAHTATDIDYRALGGAYELSGAHIKDAVVRAAFAAVEAGTAIDTNGLHDAAVAVSREQGHLVRVRDAS